MDTKIIEDQYTIPFFKKLDISIEKGKGVYVWDESGRRYLDFTSGWGVVSLGYSHPVVLDALISQAQKVMHNPCSGLTYSPARAKLLDVLVKVLPSSLTRVFFSNSGAEANDAAMKLARKVTQRPTVISFEKGFHGRTISTVSATGQNKVLQKFKPLMPHYRTVPLNDMIRFQTALQSDVAAVIIEPIQGEGGVNRADESFIKQVAQQCKDNGTLLIFDEVQTGFCRLGPFFGADLFGVQPDILTMAKGIACGFPFGGFAVSDAVAEKIEYGDHGGTYCGNPLGCAVAHAVIQYMMDYNVPVHVKQMGDLLAKRLQDIQLRYGAKVVQTRGEGLLRAIEFHSESDASLVFNRCLEAGLLINLTQGTIIRFFPSLLITEKEMNEGADVFNSVLDQVFSSS